MSKRKFSFNKLLRSLSKIIYSIRIHKNKSKLATPFGSIYHKKKKKNRSIRAWISAQYNRSLSRVLILGHVISQLRNQLFLSSRLTASSNHFSSSLLWDCTRVCGITTDRTIKWIWCTPGPPGLTSRQKKKRKAWYKKEQGDSSG